MAPEFKYMARLLVKEEDFQQAKRNAAKFGKLAVLAIKERGNTRKRAIMDWDDFVKLYWLARRYTDEQVGWKLAECVTVST